MKDNSIKTKSSNEKGVTLVALVITIAVMLIIVGISVNIGTDSLEETMLQGFYMQLETVQKRADDIATTNEKYRNTNGDIIDIKNYEGFKLSSNETSTLQTILSDEGINLNAISTGLTVDDFRYFTIQEVEDVLDLKEIDYNVFIHFDTRTIIAENGITINGKTYYMLKNNVYHVEQNTSKNQGILELKYDVTKYGTSKYKVTVTPNQIGDLTTNGILKYKKTSSKYWETANGLEIIINELNDYDILYEDSNNNKISETIKVYLEDDTPKIKIYDYS